METTPRTYGGYLVCSIYQLREPDRMDEETIRKAPAPGSSGGTHLRFQLFKGLRGLPLYRNEVQDELITGE
jgi:hypothetical protein